MWTLRVLAMATVLIGGTSVDDHGPAPGKAAKPAPARKAAKPRPAAPPKATTKLAPWQRVDPKKTQYRVFERFAPPSVEQQLRQPVRDAAYLEFLADRAHQFRSGKRRFDLRIDPDAVVDVGAPVPHASNTIALIDLPRSPALRQAILRRTKVEESEVYIHAFLSSRFSKRKRKGKANAKQGKNSYRYRDRVIVTVAAKDHSRVSAWRLDKGRWTKLYDVTPQDVADKRPATLLGNLQLQSATRYHGTFERIALKHPASGGRVFPEVAGSALANYCKTHACELPTADPDDAGSGGGSSSDTSDTPAATPPPGGGGEASDPAVYTAYGNLVCTHECSSNECNGCCQQIYAAEVTSIAGIALACHILSDLCPWCHAGCAVNETTMFAAASAMQLGCTVGCSTSRELDPQLHPNPRQCSTH